MTSYNVLYMKGRGRAEQIRMLLSELGLEWDNEFVGYEGFPALKESGKLPFGSLPLLEEIEDGKVVFSIVQGAAILRYLGRKYGMDPVDERQCALVEMLIGAAEDFRIGYFKAAYAQHIGLDPVEEEKKLKESLCPRWLGNFSKYLGDKDYFLGDSPYSCDFTLFEIIDAVEQKYSDAFGKCSNLLKFTERMRSRPKIAEFLKSDKHLA